MVALQERVRVHHANTSVYCVTYLFQRSFARFITCANLMQEWNQPCPKKHKLINFDELQSTRREILHQGSTTQPIPSMNDPRLPSLKTVEAVHFELNVSAERWLEIEFLTRGQAENTVNAKHITGSKSGKYYVSIPELMPS